MNFRTKAHLARSIEVIGFFVALYGLQRVYEGGWSSGKGALLRAMSVLLIGVVLVSYGAISARYNAARDDNDSKSERLAIETLAKLGKRAQKQPLKTKLRK